MTSGMNKKKNKNARIDSSAANLLVVNMRGMINTRRPVRQTLEQLRLIKRFNATIVPDNQIYRGMLHSAKEHLAWCELDARTAESLLSKRAETSTGNKITEDKLKDTGFSSFADLASALASGKASLDSDLGFRQFFRLSPPKGGFKRSIRRQYGEGGILGPNKELSAIVEKMV
jgi:large subunit ribosomal protein L30